MEIKTILEKSNELLNKELTVEGWARFNRPSKAVGFIELTDGSILNGIQLVYKATNESVYNKLSSISLFSYLKIKGVLVSGKNSVEIVVEDVIEVREANEDFLFGKKEHSLEFFRDVAHIRSKTKLFQSIMKIRSVAFFAIHNFYKKHGYTYVSTPIITGNDAEGAGEAFYLKTKDNKTFFSNQGTLTVSGQLHAEAYAQALGKVYTFGPTFRAENSNTTRHAAEFWMLEPEATFYDYHKMMDEVDQLIKFVVQDVLHSCKEELLFLETYTKKNTTELLNSIIKNKFNKIEYKQAVDFLKEEVKKGHKFENNDIHFGMDLGSEHEKYISSKLGGGACFVYNYPAEIKAFYMYQNKDKENTIRGFDLLVDGIGELIGGSQREDRYNELIHAVEKKNINKEDLGWYINMRKAGYAPSTGFGLGFERLVMLLTGMENIRDVIPFPRTPGKLEF